MGNKKSILFISIITSVFFIYSCNENPLFEDANNNEISGQVIDERGRGIEGVNIHYIPELINGDNPGSLGKPNPSTKISFEIPEPGIVTIAVFRYGTRDTLGYLVNNQEMNAGMYDIDFNMRNLTNGVYTYVIKCNDYIAERSMLLLILDISELAGTEPLVKTDKNGVFRLPYKMLAIGFSFSRTLEASPDPISTSVISNSFSIFMVKEGYHYYIEEITVDTNRTVRKTFRLKKL